MDRYPCLAYNSSTINDKCVGANQDELEDGVNNLLENNNQVTNSPVLLEKCIWDYM